MLNGNVSVEFLKNFLNKNVFFNTEVKNNGLDTPFLYNRCMMEMF